MKLGDIGERAGRTVRENIAHIIFAVVVVLMVFLSFVTAYPDDGEFNWFSFLINLSLQLSIFIPYRWRQKRYSGKNEAYMANKKEYSAAVKEIHAKNQLQEFGKFCEKKTDDLRRQKQLDIIHRAGIDTSTWDSGKFDGLTPEQQKAVDRAKRVQVKPINPFCITSDNTHVHNYGVEFNDKAEDARDMIAKVLPMFLWAIILTFIALDPRQVDALSTVVVIVFRIAMCLMAMFTGIMSGDSFVARKDKVILCRIDFIRLFNEWTANPNN